MVRAAAWPETGARNLVRIGLAHDSIRHVWKATGMQRSCAAGKTRHRQVEASPEEMHRASLPMKRARNSFIAIGLQQGQPEFLRVDRIILRMGAVPVERNRILYFTRHCRDMDVDSEALEALHESL